MSTTNNNGRRKNGKTTEFTPTELAQSTEQLEQLLAKEPESHPEPVTKASEQPPETKPSIESSQQAPETTQTAVSAEDLLRQAKQQTKQEVSSETSNSEEPAVETEDTAIAPKTASSEMELALGQAAKDLIELSKQAKQQRLETGIREGFEKAKDIRVGEQLGTLLALAQSESIDASELDEQLEKLRAHTDAETANIVSEALKKLGINSSVAEVKKSPLESTLFKGKLPSKNNSFKIL